MSGRAGRSTPVEQRLLAAAARVYCGNRELSHMLPAPAGYRRTVLPGNASQSAAVPADRAVGVHLRHGAQDSCAALSPAARPARGHRARAIRCTSRRRSTRTPASTTRSSSGSRSCRRSSTARSTSWATCRTRRCSITWWTATFLAAFFEKGLRANNTTVNAAMEVGCAVITNLDEHSPDGLVAHEERDRHQPLRPAAGRGATQTIGRAAREIAHADYGWDQLVAQLRPVVAGIAYGRPH